MEDLLSARQHVAVRVTSAEVCSTAYLAPLNAAAATQTVSVVGHGIRLANALIHTAVIFASFFSPHPVESV
jgi:hypothetical protein